MPFEVCNADSLVKFSDLSFCFFFKKINAKLHDGVCQRKEVLEWRVKYSKYKLLSKPKNGKLSSLITPPVISVSYYFIS